MPWYDYIYIVLAGAFGGILHAIYYNDGKLLMPKRVPDLDDQSRYNYSLGFVGDILLGIAAGLIATLPLDLERANAIYVSMISGFAGGAFIAKEAKMTEEVRSKVATQLPDLPAQEVSEDGLIRVEVTNDEH
ncbi:DUF4257 domain-containing protein [Brevibacillus fulvus]|uniref:DUF4257 domain-containing protein n=1 Tax=Brevibacillus fulvus TaxID=1125967 RepID=A0A938XT14_9BACL|nr:DUF4257 domain-containing protein [Brevibacillus fulvus]MBM7589477.1 hypothetical protein [Brevibacillus fulvus]